MMSSDGWCHCDFCRQIEEEFSNSMKLSELRELRINLNDAIKFSKNCDATSDEKYFLKNASSSEVFIKSCVKSYSSLSNAKAEARFSEGENHLIASRKTKSMEPNYLKCERNSQPGALAVQKWVYCLQCDMKLPHRQSLRNHYLSVHSELPFNCELCGKAFTKKCNLKNHIRTHQVFKIQKSVKRSKMFNFSQRKKILAHRQSLKNNYPSAHSELPLNCVSCGKTFTDILNLRNHMRTYHGFDIQRCVKQSKMFNCWQCEKIFAHRQSLRNHYLSAHSELSLECDLCGKTFTDKRNLRQHIRTYHGFAIQKCVKQSNTNLKCKQIFADPPSLGNHFMSANSELPLDCKLCGKIFTCKRNLRNHMRTYNGFGSKKCVKQPKMFSCSQCEKVFAHRPSLGNHFRSTHSVLQLNCELCGKTFTDKRNIKKHISIYHGFGIQKYVKESNTFTCLICEKTYDTLKQLKRHYQATHAKTNYICELCAKNFVNKVSLSNHTRSAHSGIQKPNEKTKIFECSHCEKKFSHHQSLRRHYKLHHAHLLLFNCKLCEETFADKCSLNNHMQSSHSNPRIYACTQCEKRYTQAQSFKRHLMLSHSGIRYYCEFCGNNFCDKAALKGHIQSVHLGIKFICESCGKDFSRRNTLKTHISSAHSNEQCERVSCEDTSTSKRKNKLKKGINKLGTNYELSQSSNIVVPSRNVPNPIDFRISQISHQPDISSSGEIHQYLKCRECFDIFYREDDLAKHMEIHNVEVNELTCFFCKQIFKKLDAYQYHLRLHYFH